MHGGTRHQRDGSGRTGRGFSLVEVLIASVILVAVMIPLMNLLFGNRGSQEEEALMAEAISLGSNIMETLISESVPFSAIDPAGGASLVKSFNNVSQAGFKDKAKAQFESLIQDAVEADPSGRGQSRMRTKGLRGKFYVYFFAGRYPDDPQVDDDWENDGPGSRKDYTRPDFGNTLTFLYLNNPARRGVPYNFEAGDKAMNNQIVLTVPQTNTNSPVNTVPYRLGPHKIRPGSTIRLTGENPDDPFYYNDPDNSRLIVGWPILPPTMGLDLGASPDERTNWGKTVQKVVTAASGASGPGEAPTTGYHPRVLDQATFRQRNGAFMKLIVGIKFAPHIYRSTKIKDADSFREFWLVSFKANLEDN